MNTILSKIITIALFIIVIGKSFATESDSSKYKVSIELGAGTSLLINKMYAKKLSDFNAFWTIRIMWHPERILSVGIEADYLTLLKERKENINTDFGKTNFDAKLFSYPINAVLSMKIWGIDLYAGAGIAFVESKVNAFEVISDAEIISGSYTYGLSYSTLLFDDFSIGVEGKGFFITSVNKAATALILKINWDFLNY